MQSYTQSDHRHSHRFFGKRADIQAVCPSNLYGVVPSERVSRAANAHTNNIALVREFWAVFCPALYGVTRDRAKNIRIQRSKSKIRNRIASETRSDSLENH